MTMHTLKALFFFIICTSMFACSTKFELIEPVEIAEGLKIPLLAPHTFNQNLAMTQIVELSFLEQKYELIFQVEISHEQIVLVGITPTGTRVFTLIYDGNSIELEGISSVIEKIKPAHLLADLQLSYWPKAALQSSFTPLNIELVETNNARHFKSKNGNIIEIHYSSTPKFSGSLDFINQVRNYKIHIKTLEYQVSAE